MKKGQRVRVQHSVQYAGAYNGCTGTVMIRTDVPWRLRAVKLDNKYNNASSYGYFYFTEDSLVACTQEEGTMNYRTVMIRFVKRIGVQETGEIAYACFDDELAVDDYVVVKSANHGLGVAQIVREVDKRPYEKREIVARFDPSNFVARLEQRKVTTELLHKMSERAAQLQDIILYERLAEIDPEMKKLLDAYKEKMV